MPGLRSTIVNTSGVRKYFDFLPQAGAYLNIDEERAFFGDVYDWIRKGPDHIKTFEYHVAQGNIEIKTSPGVLVYDPTLETTVEIAVDNSVVADVYPSYLPTTTTTTTTTTTA